MENLNEIKKTVKFLSSLFTRPSWRARRCSNRRRSCWTAWRGPRRRSLRPHPRACRRPSRHPWSLQPKKNKIDVYNFWKVLNPREVDWVIRVTSHEWIQTYHSLNDLDSDLGLGVLVGDVGALSSGFKGEPVEEGSLGWAENNLLGLLGVPLAALRDTAVTVGAFGQEPLRGSLELDADLGLKDRKEWIR